MVKLRATRKVLRLLGPASASSGASDTVLGDWFVDRFVLNRQPLLILVSSSSLLPILEPAREVRSLPERLSSLLCRRLRRLGVGEMLIRAELAAMDEVQVAPTNDRSVVGTMVDFVHSVRYCAPGSGAWTAEALVELEAMLEQTPCRVTHPGTDTVFPADRTRSLLADSAAS